LKIVSPDIVHKTDSGGVKINLMTPQEVERAYDEIMANVSQKQPGAKISGIAVQKMAPSGIEIIIGMTRDSQFGPVLMFGLGGVWVEVLKDISFGSFGQSDGCLGDDQGNQRTQAPHRFPGTAGGRFYCPRRDVVEGITFVRLIPRLKVDLNPVFAYPRGAIAVDARIVLEDSQPASATPERLRREDWNFLLPKISSRSGASNNPLRVATICAASYHSITEARFIQSI
jgi:hypothetical protein